MRWRWRKPIGHNITGRRAARMVDVGVWVGKKKKKAMKSHLHFMSLTNRR